MTQRIRPYRTPDYEKARDKLVDEARRVISERGLRKEDVSIPHTKKETESTPQADEHKKVLIEAIRQRARAKGHDQNTIRRVYGPMRKEIWNRLLREGEETRFSLMRLYLIAEALGLKIDVSVR